MRASTHASLHKQLTRYFSLDEVRTLCLHLGIPYDSLEGENTLDAKARELILYMRRQGRLAELEAYIAQERPNTREIKMPTPSIQINIKKISITLVLSLSLALAIWLGVTAVTTPSADFKFQTIVQDASGSPITNAEVVLLVGGSTAPLVVYTDRNGIALFQLKSELDGKSAVLRISHLNYGSIVQSIDLHRDMLPLTVVLPPQ